MLTDAALLRGDGWHFGEFYRRHEASVLTYMLRRCGGRADVAADLCAETFARALAARAAFDPAKGDPRGWLFGIARHVLLQSLNRGRVDDSIRRRLEMEPLVLEEESLNRIRSLDRSALRALAKIPSEQQQAVAGRVLGDMGYDALAAALECSESVVRQRVSRGLRRLRIQLEDAK